jgi:ectoine hydroxylase-related dioxygenase (phytanoyl-CoA dioxygenase family)
MKKGYAAFHHPLMVHGSYANKSSRPRRAFVLNVFADGTYSDSNEELLKGVPAIPKGKKLEGQFFPLLFDPGK